MVFQHITADFSRTTVGVAKFQRAARRASSWESPPRVRVVAVAFEIVADLVSDFLVGRTCESNARANRE